jgi:hypothetical protein
MTIVRDQAYDVRFRSRVERDQVIRCPAIVA